MRKRSLSLNGHRTSIALEPEFWTALDAFAAADGRTLPALISQVDRARLDGAQPHSPPQGLASALRVYVLKRTQLTD